MDTPDFLQGRHDYKTHSEQTQVPNFWSNACIILQAKLKKISRYCPKSRIHVLKGGLSVDQLYLKLGPRNIMLSLEKSIALLQRSFFIVLDNDEIYNSVQQNDFAKLKILLQKQSDKNPVILEPGGGSKFAISHQLDIIKGYKDILCIENLNPIDDNGNTPLHWASKHGHLDVATSFFLTQVCTFCLVGINV